MSERLLRSIQNSKGNSVSSGSTKGTMSHAPSRANMSEGEEVYALLPNGTLYLYKKINGLLFRSDFSYNGNRSIEKKLTTREFEYLHRFIDYRYFKHNLTDDIGTSEVFLPWQGTGEQSDMNNATTAFLVPFQMSLEKLLFRCETLTSTTADIRFKVYKQDNDTVNDQLSIATYTDDIASNTTFTLTKADFDTTPVVEIGKKCGISITASSDPSGTTDWWITSVWRVEVEI